MKLLKRFINWWLFTPRKSFSQKHPDFPMYFSIASLVLVMCREEVKWLINKIVDVLPF